MTQANYMQRCLGIAQNGIPWAFPNPLVGAVLVYEDRILAEGWHARYGEGHAEVNCLAQVADADKHLIPQATLYVSLEPCSHTGKTPPCVDLIIKHNIPHVVIGTRDPSDKVNGRGIEKLREAGIKVEYGIMNEEARALNKPFITFHEKKRPFITLKWTQSADGYIGKQGERIILSGPDTQFWVHDMRRKHRAIWVGMNTVLTDKPKLNNRLLPGPSPIRITYDARIEHPGQATYFEDDMPCWIFTRKLNGEYQNKRFIAVDDQAIEPFIVNYLYQHHIDAVLVEGGTKLITQLQSLNLYDDIFRIHSKPVLGNGVAAPCIPAGISLVNRTHVGHDIVEHYSRF